MSIVLGPDVCMLMAICVGTELGLQKEQRQEYSKAVVVAQNQHAPAFL
jgi:hypothetical protein